MEKVMGIDEHIGCAMSGLIADARTLVLTTIMGELALPRKEVLKSLAIYQILVLLVSQTSIRLFPCLAAAAALFVAAATTTTTPPPFTTTPTPPPTTTPLTTPTTPPLTTPTTPLTTCYS